MGEWRWHDSYASAARVLSGLLGEQQTAEVVRRLVDSGLFVQQGYYVPELAELYATFTELRRYFVETRNLRWVMCREIRDVLAGAHGRTRMPSDGIGPTIGYDVSADGETALYTGAPGSTVGVMEGDRLFGIPIRIDPAARRPMIEFGG